MPEESDTQYDWRAQFVVGFDWFRNESKISNEKEQKILAILGEAQEKLALLLAHQRPALQEGGTRWEAYKHWAPIYKVEIIESAEQEVYELLTLEERKVWKRYMSGLLHNVHLQYGQPLRIEPSPAG